MRGKVTPRKALLHHKNPARDDVRAIFDKVEGREQRFELNLYIVGFEDEDRGARPPQEDADA